MHISCWVSEVGGGGFYRHRTKLTVGFDPGGVPLFCLARGTKENTQQSH